MSTTVKAKQRFGNAAMGTAQMSLSDIGKLLGVSLQQSSTSSNAHSVRLRQQLKSKLPLRE